MVRLIYVDKAKGVYHLLVTAQHCPSSHALPRHRSVDDDGVAYATFDFLHHKAHHFSWNIPRKTIGQYVVNDCCVGDRDCGGFEPMFPRMHVVPPRAYHIVRMSIVKMEHSLALVLVPALILKTLHVLFDCDDMDYLLHHERHCNETQAVHGRVTKSHRRYTCHCHHRERYEGFRCNKVDWVVDDVTWYDVVMTSLT